MYSAYLCMEIRRVMEASEREREGEGMREESNARTLCVFLKEKRIDPSPLPQSSPVSFSRPRGAGRVDSRERFCFSLR